MATERRLLPSMRGEVTTSFFNIHFFFNELIITYHLPDSSVYCPYRLNPYWDFLKELSAISSLIRCNYISSELRYIKHYLWRSGIFSPLCCSLLLLLFSLFERDTTPLIFFHFPFQTCLPASNIGFSTED